MPGGPAAMITCRHMAHDNSTTAIDWITRLQANLGWLSRVVYARIGDQHATEDILQELAIAADSWPTTLQGHEAVNRWLYSVAVKQAALHVRTEVRGQRRTERYAERIAERGDSPEGPLKRLIASENADWVREAIQELTPRQREVLLLKYFDDLSCREISERIDIEESTVRRHLADARKRLRQVLQKLQDNSHE
jgi:RNA polymerase sigma-70 factor (ECF subfamily)